MIYDKPYIYIIIHTYIYAILTLEYIECGKPNNNTKIRILALLQGVIFLHTNIIDRY